MKKRKPPKHRSLPAHSLQDPKFRQRVKADKRAGLKKQAERVCKELADICPNARVMYYTG